MLNPCSLKRVETNICVVGAAYVDKKCDRISICPPIVATQQCTESGSHVQDSRWHNVHPVDWRQRERQIVTVFSITGQQESSETMVDKAAVWTS